VNFSVIIKNHLNEEITDVSVLILILDSSETILSEIVSEEKSVEGNSASQLEILGNTKNIEPDKYNSKMIIKCGENFIDRDLIVNIHDGNFEIVGVSYSIAN
jgi:hypothetical protein